MGYSFFVRFSLIGSGWDVEEDRLTLVTRGREEIWISADEPLQTATHFALRGTEYPTEDDAIRAGSHALAALEISFIQTHTPADFLRRKSMGSISEEFLADIQRRADAAREEGDDSPRTVLVNGRAGVIPHPSNEVHRSFVMSATGTVSKTASTLIDAYRIAIETAEPDDAAYTAFDLWSAANVMPSIDSRFLTLVNAIEALTVQRPIDGKELEAVEKLRSEVKSMDLGPDSKNNLLSRLRDLKRESVGRAAKRMLAQSVPEGVYDGKPATKFFSDLYDMRSRLTHGGAAPTHHEVAAVTADLSNLVRDVLQYRFNSAHGG